MHNKLLNLIRRAVITLTNSDSGQIANAQITWLGKTGVTEIVYPYGMAANAPVGSAVLMFSILGQEENRTGIANDQKTRFKDLKPSETAFGNPVTKSVIKFLENGDIELTGTAGQNINITGDSNVIIGGDANITIAGSTTIDSTGNIDITAPITTINGELRATGEVTGLYGGAALSFSDIRTKYNVHFHTAQGATAPTTDANNDL